MGSGSAAKAGGRNGVYIPQRNDRSIVLFPPSKITLVLSSVPVNERAAGHMVVGVICMATWVLKS